MLDKHNLNTEDFIAEFYVSADGRKTGVSQRGLARLCGVSAGTLHDHLYRGVRENEAPRAELLDPLDFEGVRGNSNIVSSSSATKVIRYYARVQGEGGVADWTIEQFMDKGLAAWIKEVTGYVEKGEPVLAADVMRELLTEVKEIRVELNEVSGKNRLVKLVMPGMPIIQDQVVLSRALPPSLTHVTLREWIDQANKKQPDRQQMSRMSQIAAGAYKSLKGKDPVRLYHKNGVKGRGYAVEDYGILETAYNKVMN